MIYPGKSCEATLIKTVRAKAEQDGLKELYNNIAYVNVYNIDIMGSVYNGSNIVFSAFVVTANPEQTTEFNDGTRGSYSLSKGVIYRGELKILGNGCTVLNINFIKRSSTNR